MTDGVSISRAAPNPKWARRLATVLVVTAFLMEAVALILLVPNAALPSFKPLGFFGGSAYALGVAFAAVGWLIVSRSPANRIGWLLLIVGWSQALVPLLVQYAAYGFGHPGSLPLAGVVSWIYAWAFMPGFLLLFPTLLLFPDGRLPSRHWRLLLWAVGGAAVLLLPAVMVGTWPHRGQDVLVQHSSTATFEADAPLLAMLAGLGFTLILPIAVATLIGLGVRFRRSSGVERQQLKWFVVAAMLTILLMFVGGVLELIPAPFDAPAGVVVGILLPVAIGIAVLRYRLYEIDVVIRRTLVYVPLTALLAGLYAATVGVSQRVFVGIVGKESDAAVILSTLIVAATFTPIKNAIQGRVDRSFRDGTDAERRLLAFSQAVDEQMAALDPARTMRAFLRSAVAAVRAAGGEAWLETPAGERSAGTTPTRGEGPRIDVPIGVDGRRFGRLELDARPSGGSFSARDLVSLDLAAQRLASTLAAQAADA